MTLSMTSYIVHGTGKGSRNTRQPVPGWLCLLHSGCTYCPGYAGVKGNDRADRLAGKATLTSGLLLGRSEVLRSFRHYLTAQSQGHRTIDCLEERGVERGSARRSSLKRTREGHRQSDEHWNRFKRNVEETSGRRGGAHTYGLFRAHRYYIELN